MNFTTYCELPYVGIFKEPKRRLVRPKTDGLPRAEADDILSKIINFRSDFSPDLTWVRDKLPENQKTLVDTVLNSSDPNVLRETSQKLQPFVVSLLQDLRDETDFKRASSLAVNSMVSVSIGIMSIIFFRGA